MRRAPSYTIELLTQLVNRHEAWHKPEEAEKWRAKLPPNEAPRE